MMHSRRKLKLPAEPVGKNSRIDQSQRRGAILICVLVCMLVAGSLLATTTLAVLRSRKEAKAYRLNVQALQLLDAGVQRAVAGIAESGTGYEGEEWSLDSSQIPIPQTNLAVITITIEKADEEPSNSTATVSVQIREAQDSGANQPRIRLKRSLEIPIVWPANEQSANAEVSGPKLENP